MPLPNNRWAGVERLMFHWTIKLGQVGDIWGYDTRYCYRTFDQCVDALDEWAKRGFEGEIEGGWHKHPDTDRIRPDGEKDQEYVGYEGGWRG